jgi:ABC-type multidrug transport system permease subunit
MTPPLNGKVLPAFALIGWRWISRNPAVAIAPVLLPFMFLYFLRLITPASLFPSEVVGAMLFVAQNIGNWVLGDSATWRIQLALQDLFVASPLSKVGYLAGIAFSNLLAAVPAFIVLAIVLALVYPVSLVGWLILLGTILVLWLLFSAIGITISSRIKSRREIWPVGNFAFTALGMLSPLYYSLGTLPPALQDVARFLPGTYAALLAKGGMGLNPLGQGDMLLDAFLLVASATAGILLSLQFYRWRIA